MYVGPLERVLYPAEGLAKFDDGRFFRTVYDAEGVRIYQVRR